MRILITGGTGFIGNALVNSLIEKDHHIYILTRNPEAHRSQLNQSVSLLKWDGKTVQDWGQVIEETEAVINLAGENIAGTSLSSIFFKRLTPLRKQLLLESRLNSGKALMDAIRNASRKPAVFIQASAVGYYGNRGNEILCEESLPGNDFTSQLCIRWEESIAELDSLNVRRIIIRTAGMVLGKSGGAFPFLLLPFRFFIGGPLGSGRQWMSWIHLVDEILAIRFLLENENAQGIFNLCAPNPITNKEFSTYVGKIIHRPSWLPVPKFIFKLMLGEKANIILASQRQIPEKLLRLGFDFSYPNLDLALRNLLLDEN